MEYVANVEDDEGQRNLIRLTHTVKFDVDSIHVSQWNKAPFQKLVLSSGEKELLLAFSEQNVRSALRSDEAVKGKGKAPAFESC
jgi:hypothetical protein